TTASSVSTRTGSGSVVSAAKGPHGSAGGAPSPGGPPPSPENSLAKTRVYVAKPLICGKNALRARIRSPRARSTPASAIAIDSFVSSARASASSSEIRIRAGRSCAATVEASASASRTSNVVQIRTDIFGAAVGNTDNGTPKVARTWPGAVPRGGGPGVGPGPGRSEHVVVERRRPLRRGGRRAAAVQRTRDPDQSVFQMDPRHPVPDP